MTLAPGDVAFDVEFRGITKRFGPLVAVNRVDLQVNKGEFLSLLGPSGCGKTTSLRMIAGFEQPDEGELLIGGTDAVGVPPYRRNVNTVFQSYALFPHMSVIDNVAYGLKQRGTGKAERIRLSGEALELVQLTGRQDHRPSMLSGGQQQRVALARALVMHPQVLLLDEPLGALDLKLRKEMQVELKRIQEQVGITFIYVTHDQEEALSMSDRVAVMSNGVIEQLDEPRVIYDNPRTSFVAEFIGDMNFLSGVVTEQVGGQFIVDAGGGVVIRGHGAASRGSSVRVGIRPERMTALPGSPEQQANSAKATVLSKMYLGDQIQISVSLANGQRIIVREQRASANPVLDVVYSGDEVLVSWDDKAPLLLEQTVPLQSSAEAEQYTPSEEAAVHASTEES
jgi:spermidine/putrescine transport system ATP-binding protein